MTESDWNACTTLAPMWDFISSKASERKLRLFACACCRRVWHVMTDARHRRAVEAAERLADDPSTEADLASAMQPVIDLWANLSSHRNPEWQPIHYMTAAVRHLNGGSAAWYAASYAARGEACCAGSEGSPAWRTAEAAEEAAQCALLRDIFGYPARPFCFDPAWLSGDGRSAVERARAIYEENRFAELPLLAEVLQRAGCRDRAVLDHCRASMEHVRGCWVVDALLGRESAVRIGLTTAEDWRTCDDPTPLLHFLRDKGSERKWRLFAVACCHRIDPLIAEERSRRAVAVAARYADGIATEKELEQAQIASQQAEDEAKRAEYQAEAEADFCTTPKYAAISCRWYAAMAARSAVCRDPRKTDGEPGSYEADFWRPSYEWAVAAIGDHAYADFAGVQEDSHDEGRRAAEEAASAAEQRAQCELLHDLFGEHFGSPGCEGDWLPFSRNWYFPAEKPQQWCLLPTPRKLNIRRDWLAWNDGTVRRLAQSIYDENAFDRLPILADALEDAGCTDADILNHCRQLGEHVRGCWVIDLLLGKS